MNTTSNKIKTVLDQIEPRLAELSEAKQRINLRVTELEDGFINNHVPLEDLQAEQSKLATLSNSVNTLQTKQNELQTAFDEAVKAELRGEQVEQAKAIALEADRAYSDYIKLRSELNKSISSLGQKMADSVVQFVNKQYECRNLISTAGIPFAELNLPTETSNLVSGKACSIPPLEFGDLMLDIENRITSGRRQQTRSKTAEV